MKTLITLLTFSILTIILTILYVEPCKKYKPFYIGGALHVADKCYE